MGPEFGVKGQEHGGKSPGSGAWGKHLQVSRLKGWDLPCPAPSSQRCGVGAQGIHLRIRVQGFCFRVQDLGLRVCGAYSL